MLLMAIVSESCENQRRNYYFFGKLQGESQILTNLISPKPQTTVQNLEQMGSSTAEGHNILEVVTPFEILQASHDRGEGGETIVFGSTCHQA